MRGKVTIANSTLSGNSAQFDGGDIYAGGGALTINNSTLSGNSAGTGGAIFSNGEASVLISNSILSGNSATNGSGGSIRNFSGTWTIINSTLFGNSVSGIAPYGGGGIVNLDNMTIINSTLSGNSAQGYGGSIYSQTYGALTIINSTITGNSATTDGGGIMNQLGKLFIGNSLIAGNTVNNSLAGQNNEILNFISGSFTSKGHNLFGVDGHVGVGGWNVVLAPSDLTPPKGVTLDQVIKPLANNGGPTQTHLPATGSLAINRGDNALIPLNVTDDQRGYKPRIVGGMVDIGSVEVGAAVNGYELTVTKSGNLGVVTSSPAGINCGAVCSAVFAANTAVTLTATPTTGNQFSGWSGACTGTTTTCTVSMTAAKSVIATFTPLPVLTVGKTGSGAGVVTGAGISCGADCREWYQPNTLVTLTAAPYAGSAFVSWNGCTPLATNPKQCTVTLNAAKTVVATFNSTTAGKTALTFYKAGVGLGTVVSSPVGLSCGTTCTGGLAYFSTNTNVLLTATPAVGSTFSGWSGCNVNPSNPLQCTTTLNVARVVTATFTRPVLTVVKGGSGSGLVSGTGIYCGLDCTEPYNLNTNLTLTATPAAGSRFIGWSGACAGTALTCNVSLSASKSVGATFATLTAGTYAVTVYKTGVGLGTVASTPTGISCGTACVANFPSNTIVTLTATPAVGSTFVGWSGCTVTSNPQQCTVPATTARLVIASFTRPILTVTKTGSGTVTSTPTGINCGTDCSEPYNLNTSITLTATPTAGWQFAGWGGACTGTAAACTVSMTAAKTVTATFKPKLTVTKVGTGTVTSTPAGISCGTACVAPFTLNSNVTLTATPAIGQKFKSWTGCTAVSGATCTVGMTAAKTVTATFGL